MLFLTNLHTRCRAAELWWCGEVPSSAQGDDDRHARREEPRASGIAKLVKSNLGTPGLSKYRVVHLTDEIALAEISSGVGAEDQDAIEPKFNIGDARMYNQRVLDLTGWRVYARSSGGSGL